MVEVCAYGAYSNRNTVLLSFSCVRCKFEQEIEQIKYRASYETRLQNYTFFPNYNTNS